MNWKMMMALGLTAGLVLHAGCAGGAVRPPSAMVQRAETLAQFEAHLETQRNALKIPGMAVIILKNQTSWSKGFGLADVQNSTAVAPTTSFHLASLTKTFPVAPYHVAYEGKSHELVGFRRAACHA